MTGKQIRQTISVDLATAAFILGMFGQCYMDEYSKLRNQEFELERARFNAEIQAREEVEQK